MPSLYPLKVILILFFLILYIIDPRVLNLQLLNSLVCVRLSTLFSNSNTVRTSLEVLDIATVIGLLALAPMFYNMRRFLPFLSGSEFQRPALAFYCDLCKEFAGDTMSAEHHLKTKNHNKAYQVGFSF